MTESKRPLRVFLCYAHIIPLWDADRDAVKALYDYLTTPPRRVGVGDNGANIMPEGYACLNKEEFFGK